jgi:HAMP domain-containing protein
VSTQWLVVAMLVAVAALYVTWRLIPGALRRRVRRSLGLREPASTVPSSECERCNTPHH